jgi:multidrug efflux pump subunit AcrB
MFHCPSARGSTLTPVVVFIPLAFLEGIWGVFFRALAVTMVVALLTSLLLALTFIPSLAAWVLHVPSKKNTDLHTAESGGFLLRRVIRLYEFTVRLALRYRWATVGISLLALAGAAVLYGRLDSDFLPELDEGGFVIDYVAPPGVGPMQVNQQLLQAEQLLRKIPEVESYSRRSGAALGLHIVEPNTGDFLVKLKPERHRSTDEVLAQVADTFRQGVPGIHFEFEGILTDLIGDLTWSDRPIEIKVFSTDKKELTRRAGEIEEKIKQLPGIVDTFTGIVYTGKAVDMRVRQTDAENVGMDATDVSDAVEVALIGRDVSSVLDNDREVNVRLMTDTAKTDALHLGDLPIAGPEGKLIRLSKVADIVESPEQLELEREDLRQEIAVTARLEGRDLGSAMADVRRLLSADKSFPPGSIEYGGLYEQQQESSRQLTAVLAIAILLVFLVAMIEFRSLSAPIAIVFGATLSVLGIVFALYVTGTTLSIIAYLGAIIGMGIVHKNGILMLDHVEHLHSGGMALGEALVQAGRRRLRPVLMTSLAAALGMLPLAYGIGSGADMLRPLAITVIGAVCISVLLSLVATPAAYLLVLDIQSALRREQD